MTRSLWLAAGLALALCTLPAMFRQESAGGKSIVLSPDGKTISITFDAADGMPLGELLVVAQTVFGQPVHFEAAESRDTRIVGIGSQSVDRARFVEFFEATLNALNFVVIEQGGALWVRKSGGAATAAKPGYLKTQAPFVPAEQLPSWKNRYRVITTSIRLKHVLAQEATNMLQSYFADPLLESVRGVSATNTLILTGHGNVLANIAELLAVADADGANALPAVQLVNLSSRVEALEAKVGALEAK